MNLLHPKKQLESRETQRRARKYREMMRAEAKIGGQIFGDNSTGRRREFVCWGPSTWIWHEEWADETGRYHHVTTRYEVVKNKIEKIQNGKQVYVSPGELENLLQAAKDYRKRVASKLYR